MAHVFERYRPLIDNWDCFVETLEQPPPVFACYHPGRWTGAGFDAWLQQLGWEAATMPAVAEMRRLPAGTSLGGRWQFFAGLYQVLQWTSALAVEVLDPQPGDRVLDLCAAPGMKTTRLSLKVGDTGTVVANELNRRRLKGLRQTCERLGLTNVSLLEHDGCNLPAGAGPYDRVLVDAPCSCEGTTRKFSLDLHEDDPWFHRGKTGVQAALLRKAVQLCRAGGTIVYSTCTYAPEENEGIVDRILREYPGQVEVEPIPGAEQLGEPATCEWEGCAFHPSLQYALRIWPHRHDTAGFFIARLRKLGPAMDETEPATFAPSDDADLAQWLRERFGLPAAALAPYHLYRDGEADALIVPRGHRPPVAPSPLRRGLLAMRTHLVVPKLTVPGALLLGQAATRNRLELTEQQAARYLERSVFPVAPDQLDEATEGYVLLRREEQVVGLGLLQQGDEGPEIRSLFPRRWKRTRRT